MPYFTKHLLHLTFLGLLIMVFCSCKKDVKGQQTVYFNDFESADLTNITGGTIDIFNGTHVLGRYNLGNFNLIVPNLPKHDVVQVSFDLYIHDTWDGNTLDNGYAGPDIWKFLIDGQTYINTTFSNSACPVNQFCPPQSYPENYPNNNNNPKTGAFNINLPGACYLATNPQGTTQYKIFRQISHSKSTVQIQCLDSLVQKNIPVGNRFCDESWSIDNLKVNVITL